MNEEQDQPTTKSFRQRGQEGLRRAKELGSDAADRAREQAAKSEKATAALDRTGEAWGVARDGATRKYGEAHEKLRTNLGLGELTDELEQNLETALAVIAAQQERIERLEARLERMERAE